MIFTPAPSLNTTSSPPFTVSAALLFAFTFQAAVSFITFVPAGVKFDKRNKTVIAYTNQTGEKPVYYFSNEEYFMLSSSVYIVSKILQKNNLQYTLQIELFI